VSLKKLFPARSPRRDLISFKFLGTPVRRLNLRTLFRKDSGNLQFLLISWVAAVCLLRELLSSSCTSLSHLSLPCRKRVSAFPIMCSGRAIKEFVPELNYTPFVGDVWATGSRAPCILNIGTREMSGQLHSPAVLFPGKEYTTLRRPESHSRPCKEEQYSFPCRELIPLILVPLLTKL
jgi:hypothetical protein